MNKAQRDFDGYILDVSISSLMLRSRMNRAAGQLRLAYLMNDTKAAALINQELEQHKRALRQIIAAAPRY